jgi:hypothetical protein
LELRGDEKELIKQYCFLTDKPYLILFNVDEGEIGVSSTDLKKKYGLENEDGYVISSKIENELASIADSEQKVFIDSLGIQELPLNRVIRAAFDKLHLIQFFTTGADETRSWTIVNGTKATQAAGVIHTDFEKGFIKAEVVSYDDFVKFGGWVKCRENGKLRVEGKEYVMKDGDIAEFKFN